MDKTSTAPTRRGPSERFIGDVYNTPLHRGVEPSRLIASLVRFAPGARTNWHRHVLGQTLHATDGIGLVVSRSGAVFVMRPGDTVHTPPGEEHWHGATVDNFMCHLTMLERAEDGSETDWLEPVSQEQYEAAVAEALAQLTPNI